MAFIADQIRIHQNFGSSLSKGKAKSRNPSRDRVNLTTCASLLIDNLDWTRTEEGHEYWSDVYEKIMDYADHTDDEE